jgi:hypothetical protein
MMYGFSLSSTPLTKIAGLASAIAVECNKITAEGTGFTAKETDRIKSFTDGGGFKGIEDRTLERLDQEFSRYDVHEHWKRLVIVMLAQEVPMRVDEMRLLDTRDAGDNNWVDCGEGGTGRMTIRVQKSGYRGKRKPERVVVLSGVLCKEIREMMERREKDWGDIVPRDLKTAVFVNVNEKGKPATRLAAGSASGFYTLAMEGMNNTTYRKYYASMNTSRKAVQREEKAAAMLAHDLPVHRAHYIKEADESDLEQWQEVHEKDQAEVVDRQEETASDTGTESDERSPKKFKPRHVVVDEDITVSEPLSIMRTSGNKEYKVKCQNCGEQSDDGSEICVDCGAPLGDPDDDLTCSEDESISIPPSDASVPIQWMQKPRVLETTSEMVIRPTPTVAYDTRNFFV